MYTYPVPLHPITTQSLSTSCSLHSNEHYRGFPLTTDLSVASTPHTSKPIHVYRVMDESGKVIEPPQDPKVSEAITSAPCQMEPRPLQRGSRLEPRLHRVGSGVKPVMGFALLQSNQIATLEIIFSGVPFTSFHLLSTHAHEQSAQL